MYENSQHANIDLQAPNSISGPSSFFREQIYVPRGRNLYGNVVWNFQLY